MARPRAFDRDEALLRAMGVFWAKGYAATSTEDLIQAMQIGRQSLYGAFGDKRTLYVEALSHYQQVSVQGHLARLRSGDTPLAGVEALLVGLIPEDDVQRALGCMGVGAVAEFGAGDAVLADLRARSGATLFQALVARLRDAQACDELDPGLDPEQGAEFLQLTMQGLQLGARAGADRDRLVRLARFSLDRLKATPA
ncbi:MAG: TetR/AcrR family transcriptional regulator [Caulobacteraceae bacterium]